MATLTFTTDEAHEVVDRVLAKKPDLQKALAYLLSQDDHELRQVVFLRMAEFDAQLPPRMGK